MPYRLALGLAYDGTHFQGWQTQPSGASVQDHLERALASFVGEPVACVCAGRTDAGVHAKGQVVHIDVEVERPVWNWVRGVNSFLPSGIRVQWASPVAPDFHARFSARSRAYRYTLYNHAVDSPLQSRFATWVFQPLDHLAMHAAAQALVGEHDFSSFRAAQCQAQSPVRRLSSVIVSRDNRLVTIDIRANAFLHHMVRNIVGSLVAVGQGVQKEDHLANLLAVKDRRLADRTFPAQGLCLEHVEYDQLFVCEPESKSVD
ncbi:MAG: tRNA pseudouridine(38-40) synthase TruA [Burkholderiaceae bacterium]|jgi:tRNA pseudouridine38-40 synthase|nr:tRNA pseudouridine(38-40) synthase TruA [Burkholderiaceae bacterium]MDP4740855.1 tRNA pseudouridine(38-40) synthase TruA [Burkholderiaceae bacterium]MDP4828568.1 tRNA pseudouridine(38-40) synthase TruA [Burkholderiaceae bacterium]MDP4919442.1 tRNA pseudouridine(38-40) synthase TruA [Burkholderiaceae bacterium]MDP5127438.1 tRNA pseudouridine(38-40) synthase TruA [Burkholderiaceae bacterium]